MRLTNTIRDAYVRAAMADVPQTDYDEQARKIVVEYAEARFKAVAGISADKVRGWLDNRWMNTPGTLNSVYAIWDECNTYSALKEMAHAEIWAALEALAEAKLAQAQNLSALEDHLRGLAYSCTTRAKLAEALPEFEKYLPAEIDKPMRSLPMVQNLVADFVRVGWPKTQAQAQTA